MGATKLLAAVDKLDSTMVVGKQDNAVGVLGEGVDFVIFCFLTSFALMKALKFLFARFVALISWRCESPLLWRITVPLL